MRHATIIAAVFIGMATIGAAAQDKDAQIQQLQQQVKELQATVAMLRDEVATAKATNKPLRDELATAKITIRRLEALVPKDSTSQPASQPVDVPILTGFAYPLSLGQRALLSVDKVDYVVSDTEAIVEIKAYSKEWIPMNDMYGTKRTYSPEIVYLSGVPTKGWVDGLKNPTFTKKVIAEISDTKRHMGRTMFFVTYIEDFTDQKTTPAPSPVQNTTPQKNTTKPTPTKNQKK